MEIDLHGYHPDDLDRIYDDEAVCLLNRIVQQAWEMGESELRLIHGHGRNRGISPGFVNTNTGYFGLRVRSALRRDDSLRKWIKYTTLDCSHDGSTNIKLKKNAAPTRIALDPLPPPEVRVRFLNRPRA